MNARLRTVAGMCLESAFAGVAVAGTAARAAPTDAEVRAAEADAVDYCTP